jgi:hypothetical protein
MLAILPEPAATVVAMATFTGARKGEIRGFQVYYPMRRRAPMDEVRVFGTCPSARRHSRKPDSGLPSWAADVVFSRAIRRDATATGW